MLDPTNPTQYLFLLDPPYLSALAFQIHTVSLLGVCILKV